MSVSSGEPAGHRSTLTGLNPSTACATDSWQYDQLTAGFRLPLQLTNSKYIQGINLSAYYNYLHVTGYDLPFRYATEVGSAGSLNALTYGFSYSRLLRQSKRDVAPRWGQSLSVNYRTTPFGGKLTAEQWGVQGNSVFPRSGKTPLPRLRGGYQEQAQGTYVFGRWCVLPARAALRQRRSDSGGQCRLPTSRCRYALVAGAVALRSAHKSRGFYDRADGQSSCGGARCIWPVTGLRNPAAYLPDYRPRCFVCVSTHSRVRNPFEAGFRTIYNLTTGQWLVQPLVIDIGF